jgi:GGDEF domain-containing protein
MPRFGRPISLVHKLVLSYAAMAVFTAASLVTSGIGLYSLGRMAHDIARNDLSVLTGARELREAVSAEEGFIGKFVILGSPDFRQLFAHRDSQSTETLRRVAAKLPPESARQLTDGYEEFRRIADEIFSGSIRPAHGTVRSAAAPVYEVLEEVIRTRQKLLETKLTAAERDRNLTMTWMLAFSLVGFLLAAGAAGFFVYRVLTSLTKLKEATHRIAEGDFDYDPSIADKDEFGELADDFISMAAQLKELEQMSLDASPLTRLPGNIAIERSLNRRLRDGEAFALGYADLDNFKAYNDHYGYVRASEVIRMTGEIIYDSVKTFGNGSDFVGHIGGDDFVMIVSSENVAPICDKVLREFDRKIRECYTAADLAAGFIVGDDRYGVHREFPIMTLSIAVLTCSPGEYSSAAEIARLAAEIKDRVKVAPGSNYFIHSGETA